MSGASGRVSSLYTGTNEWHASGRVSSIRALMSGMHLDVYPLYGIIFLSSVAEATSGLPDIPVSVAEATSGLPDIPVVSCRGH